LSASSSTTTSNLLPAADKAETKLRRARNRPRKKERIVSEVCVVLSGQNRQLHLIETYVVRLKLRGRLAPTPRPLQTRASAGPAKTRHWPSWKTAREHQPRVYTSNTTTPLAQIHTLSHQQTTTYTSWHLSLSGPRLASTSTGPRATSPPFSGVWSSAAAALLLWYAVLRTRTIIVESC
jgi:hypothetical protein